MSHQEAHPTGRFPTREVERVLRDTFLDKTNPVLTSIRDRLKELGLPRQRNLPINLLAIYYGVYFYNLVSRGALFTDDKDFPIKIIRDPHDRGDVYVMERTIYLNIESRQTKKLFYFSLNEEVDLFEYEEINLPIFISRIIDGIEEAQHLHLDLIHDRDRPNSNSRTDHRFPRQLWRHSDIDPVSYKAKLWHEFASLVVQKTYLNNYIVGEYPEVVVEFNTFFNRVVKERQKWVRRKEKII